MNLKPKSKTKVLEVVNLIFDCFFDHKPNTKHLDYNFQKQITIVETYLKKRLEIWMSKVFKLNIKDYKKLENLLHSWWVSLPDGMQQEIRKFYDNPKTFEVE